MLACSLTRKQWSVPDGEEISYDSADFTWTDRTATGAGRPGTYPRWEEAPYQASVPAHW